MPFGIKRNTLVSGIKLSKAWIFEEKSKNLSSDSSVLLASLNLVIFNQARSQGLSSLPPLSLRKQRRERRETLGMSLIFNMSFDGLKRLKMTTNFNN